MNASPWPQPATAIAANSTGTLPASPAAMSTSSPAARPARPGFHGPGRLPRPEGSLGGRRDQQQRARCRPVHQQVPAAQRRRRVGRNQGQDHVRDRPGQQAGQGRSEERGPGRGGQARPPGPPSLARHAQRSGQRGGCHGRRGQQADLHQVAERPRRGGVLRERPGQHGTEPAGRGGRRGGEERRAGPPPARLGEHQARGECPGAGADREPLHRPAREQPARSRRGGQQRRPAGRRGQPGHQHRPVAGRVAERAADQQGHDDRRRVDGHQQRHVQWREAEGALVPRVQRGGQVRPGQQDSQGIAEPAKRRRPGWLSAAGPSAGGPSAGRDNGERTRRRPGIRAFGQERPVGFTSALPRDGGTAGS